jgi:hypothetical protein
MEMSRKQKGLSDVRQYPGMSYSQYPKSQCGRALPDQRLCFVPACGEKMLSGLYRLQGNDGSPALATAASFPASWAAQGLSSAVESLLNIA